MESANTRAGRLVGQRLPKFCKPSASLEPGPGLCYFVDKMILHEFILFRDFLKILKIDARSSVRFGVELPIRPWRRLNLKPTTMACF